MSRPRPGLAIAFFAAVALLFVALLVVGLSSGELPVPSRGSGIRMHRGTNPIGFYAVAAFYAALAALSSYPLWLMLRRGPDAARPSVKPRSMDAASGPILQLEGRVSVTSEGRSGEVHVALDGADHAFWWEFGGGDCVAIVAVPTADEWKRLPALAAYPRDAFLAALAREVARLQCPGASYTIEPRTILFRS